MGFKLYICHDVIYWSANLLKLNHFCSSLAAVSWWAISHWRIRWQWW